MTRFLLYLAIFTCGLIQHHGIAKEVPPNIVFIVSDDHAWTDYGFMGHPHIRTPHLDKLAKESRVYRRGYVTSSLCCPSLTALLTGKYPHQSKITGNEPPRPEGMKTGAAAYRDPEFRRQVLELNQYMEQQPRLPAALQELGYRSFQTGKWWAGKFTTGGFTHGMSEGDLDAGGRHGDAGLQIGRKTMTPIYEFIAEAKAATKPFCLWYAPLLPHDPHDPPAELLKKYQSLTQSLSTAKYWAMVEFFDQTCGQLLDHLETQGLAQNTIVVYIADNGWIPQPNGPKFRKDSKLSQYDGGLRTPILIKWPGKMQPGFSDIPVSAIDIAPTIYDAVKLPIPQGLQGVSLLNEEAAQKRNGVEGACFLHNAVDIREPGKNLTHRWVVAGDWKLILPHAPNVLEANRPGRNPAEVELYHLATDPMETFNLAGAQPERVEALRKRLDAWWDGK